MKTYRAMYRCRLCGKAFYNGAETGGPGALLHLTELIVSGKPANPNAPHLLMPHYCGKPFESMGLADFIGWDLVGEE